MRFVLSINLVFVFLSFPFNLKVFSLSFSNADKNFSVDRTYCFIQTDTDNDGVPDVIDRDDDNDGIPDEVECPNQIIELLNGGFEDPVIPASTWKLKKESDVLGWETTATDNNIEFWSTGFLSVPAQEGNQFVELNATQVSTLYQSFTLDGSGGTLEWSMYHRGRRGSETAYAKIGATLNDATVQVTMTDGTSAWGFYSGSYEIPEGQTTLVLALESLTGGSHGNFLDDVRISINQSCLDSDNDGIPNSLDLDSDNDGVPDIVEAGGVDTDYDGEVDYLTSGDPTTMLDRDGDGLVDTYDDEDDGNGSPGWSPGVLIRDSDTDGDGIQDRVDMDSDNDGIADYIENVCSICPTAGGPSGSTADSDNNGVLDFYENMNSDNTDNATGSNVGVIPYVESNDLEDLLPDYIDLDTDGDGAFDWVEGFDINSDGNAANDIIDLALLYEQNNGAPEDYPDMDSDSDGIPDWLDNMPYEAGYEEAVLPPFLDHTQSAWIDNNNNGLVDVFDEAMNGFMAPIPNADNINDSDWRDNATTLFLPVELLFFKANPENCKAKLEWITETEVNFDYFLIERSANGYDFEVIDQIYGLGGDVYTVYDYIDESAAENNFYRLKLVDLDGTFQYSDITFLSIECAQQKSDYKIVAYPNPVSLGRSEVFLKIKASRGLAKVVLCNMTGAVLNTIQKEIQDGWNSLSIDISDLQVGAYTISYVDEKSMTVTEKLIVNSK